MVVERPKHALFKNKMCRSFCQNHCQSSPINPLREDARKRIALTVKVKVADALRE